MKVDSAGHQCEIASRRNYVQKYFQAALEASGESSRNQAHRDQRNDQQTLRANGQKGVAYEKRSEGGLYQSRRRGGDDYVRPQPDRYSIAPAGHFAKRLFSKPG